MNKEKFIEMLNKAEEDEHGRLYVLGEYNNKIYLGTITTICEDIFKDSDGAEIYDRHFWNDDTLECYVISTKHNNSIKYRVPNRIKEIVTIGCNVQVEIGDKKTIIPTESMINDILIAKVNELIKQFNRYECLIEKSDKNE